MTELNEFRDALRSFRFAVIACGVIIVLSFAAFAALLFLLLPPLLERSVVEALNYYNSTVQTP